MSRALLPPLPARFSAIDVHTHLGGVETWPGQPPDFGDLLRAMNLRNVAILVDFKAPFPGHEVGGARVAQRLARYPDTARFKLFANVPLSNDVGRFPDASDYGHRISQLLTDAIDAGASGLKIKFQAGSKYWVTDASGDLLPLDSDQLDPLWSQAAKLRIPVLLHFACTYVAEHQPGGSCEEFRWEMLMYERERVLRKHPRLLLIGAHWGSSAQHFDYLRHTMHAYPNLYVEGAARPEALVPNLFGAVNDDEKAFLIAFQDRILFGTDYMESTQRWLRSYLERLDSMIPSIERWPVPDSMLRKYYQANARKLLKLAGHGAPPVAHAGFTQTAITGSEIRLDASASFAFDDAPLRFEWKQIAGRHVFVSSPTRTSANVVAHEPGEYRFRVTVRDTRGATASHEVTIWVVPPDGCVREENGRAVMEAENYWRASDPASRWRLGNGRGGYSGPGYMEALPASPDVSRATEGLAELTYLVSISQPGTYVVQLRGTSTGRDAGRLQIGLDGGEVPLASWIGPFPTTAWEWLDETEQLNSETGRPARHLAVLNIAEAGAHVINIRIEEGGFSLDKIMLVRHMDAARQRPRYRPPAGSEPRESTTGSCMNSRLVAP